MTYDNWKTTNPADDFLGVDAMDDNDQDRYEYETAEHDVAMNIRSMQLALEELINIAGRNAVGFSLVKRDLPDLTRVQLNLGALLSLLWAKP